MRMIIFGVVASLVWALLHAYVGHRLIRTSRLSRPWKYAAWGLLASHFFLDVVAFSLRRYSDAAWVDGLQWAAYLGMGAFVLVLTLVLLRDILILVPWAVRRAGRWLAYRRAEAVREAATSEPADPSRRILLTGGANLGIFALSGVGTTIGFREARDDPEVERVDVPVAGLHADLEGFTIAQISDIHLGPTIKRDFLERTVRITNELSSDLVALTGDLVDGYVEDMREEIEPLDDLTAPYGRFFVTGNHEYYWDAPAWCEEVERHDMTVLVDAHRTIEVGGATMVVGGVADYSASRFVDSHASDPSAAIEGAPEHDFSLLLAHQPKNVWEAADAGFDLQLSGHTHGGQFYPWNFFVGLAHPFTAGLGRHDDRMWIYVSRGTGYWGPPLRLGVPSEITLLTLRRA